MTEQELFYESEIAPVLKAIGERCIERGMAMLATVEYEPGQRGSTIVISDKSCLAMQLMRICDSAGSNIDGYMINVRNYCRDNNIPMDSSLVMKKVFG